MAFSKIGSVVSDNYWSVTPDKIWLRTPDANNIWYTKAVLWASEAGVTAGTSADKFSPSATCTRAQIVTFLYRDMAS